ncbi:hypothetical protein OZ13_13605 [Xanthomonas cannabis pv. cannabis]|uniref:hypothetical protein n=1 Tax=Xanthomonas cannabis TaxID=1885674 RepID=UPI00057426A1|nr:hypothetical protein [Xanthomonas cannabis]KHL53456.1 hypothetical protein OZ10_15305 [Xanthomonas cannabis pv. cannabis]KHL54582.1 hypothetical protein OZ13_13605 [Xanthomonas cannabis pv. cannabis]MCC8441787.1 hypothetical protein [Xanthomonas cannabis]
MSSLGRTATPEQLEQGQRAALHQAGALAGTLIDQGGSSLLALCDCAANRLLRAQRGNASRVR